MLAGLLCLLGERVARVVRWIPLIVGGPALVVGASLLLLERSYYRLVATAQLARGEASVVVGLWDWAAFVAIAGGCVAVCFAFAGARPEPRRDGWLLLCLGLLAACAGAGAPVLVYAGLCAVAGASVSAMLGARRLTADRVVAGLAGVAAAVLASFSWSHAMALTMGNAGVLDLFDLTQFPQSRLATVGPLARSLLVGLAALAGAWPMCMASRAAWRAAGLRAGVASLAVGSTGVALAVWLRVLVHGGAQIEAGLRLGSGEAALPILLGMAGLALLWRVWELTGAARIGYSWQRLVHGWRVGSAEHLPEPSLRAAVCTASVAALDRIREAWRREAESALLGALTGLQATYAVLALILASSGVAEGYYAFVACFLNLVLSGSGAGLCARLPHREVGSAARSASWASLVGAPPFVGFFARFLLLRAASEGLGGWAALLLVVWVAELVAVIHHVRTAILAPAGGVAGAAARIPERRVTALAWLTLSTVLQLAGGPLALLLGDQIARQIAPGG